MRKKLTGDQLLTGFFYLLLALAAFACLFPIIFAFVGSLNVESEVTRNGFSLFPATYSLDTYKYVFQSQGHRLLNAYKTSIIVTVGGTLISVVITVMYAYVISIRDFKYGNFFAFFAYFTMI